MNVKIEIHKNKVDIKLKKLDSWKVPSKTKEEVRKFIDKAKIGQVNEGRKLSNRTLSKYLTLLKRDLELIHKETSKITKKDVEDFDKKISNLELKSVIDYRRALKIFFNWKMGASKTDKIAGWLDTRDKKKTPDYLTEQEVIKLYKKCKDNSERFLIAVLFDSGARAEEFLNIRFEDIQLPEGNENYAKITLKEEYSKTKGRTISLYWRYSLEVVRDYLRERKLEEIRGNDQVYNKTYDGLRMFLFRLGKKVLNKKIYPHLFRHSSATYYAPKMNRQQLCYRYGWTFSSDMPDVYISRAGMESKELDDKFSATDFDELKVELNRLKEQDKIKTEENIMVSNKLKEYEKEFEILKDMISKVSKKR